MGISPCEGCLLKPITLPSTLRVAEQVWSEGVLLRHFPPEVGTIKSLDDAWAIIKTEDGQARFEESLRQWMKSITELLQESEQLRIESDVSGPQVRTTVIIITIGINIFIIILIKS